MPVDHVLDAYNGAMAQIAGLSKHANVKQLTFRMKVEWEKATEKEKQLCEEKVGEACRAVCGVIAPNGSEELFNYFIKRANASNNELDALITAYKQAPTKKPENPNTEYICTPLCLNRAQTNPCALSEAKRPPDQEIEKSCKDSRSRFLG